MNEYSHVDLAEAGEYGEADFVDHITRRDGWVAALLLAAVIFGPRTAAGGLLPPMRMVDLVLVILLAVRWFKARRIYGGFLLSYRVRLLAVLMPLLALIVLVSIVFNVMRGRNIFYVKDLYSPIAILRMMLIAAIAASFNIQEIQARQFAKGLVIVSFLVVALALAQKFAPFSVSGLVERLYVIEYTRLEIATAGTTSRVVGTFGNPNMFSSCLVALAAGTLAVAINIRGVLKYSSIAAFLGLAFTILITTGSRTGYLAFMVIVFCAIVFSLRGRSVVPAILFFFFMVALFLIVRANADALPLNPRMQQLVAGESALDDSLYARFRMWGDNIALAKESPLLGVGVAKAYYQMTDNGYIMMLMRTGILGLSVYLLLLGSLLVKGLKGLHCEGSVCKRMILLTAFLVLINHLIFELTADFFWNIELGELFSLFMGLLCGISGQAVADRRLELQAPYYEGNY
jgi:O-antigen ligase